MKITEFNDREKILLQMADNGLILNHRLCEWCSYAPELELELSLANIGLDHLGQARVWLEALISSLKNRGIEMDEDQIAYLRDEQDYTNLLLLEQVNGDFAQTIVKLFFYDVYHLLWLSWLEEDSSWQPMVLKMKSEVMPHRKFSEHWMKILVGGTEESKRRVSEAVQNLWPYVGEFFYLTDEEKRFFKNKTEDELKRKWWREVAPILSPLSLELEMSKINFYLPSGKQGHHTEALGYLLGEFQSLHRRYQSEGGARW